MSNLGKRWIKEVKKQSDEGKQDVTIRKDMLKQVKDQAKDYMKRIKDGLVEDAINQAIERGSRIAVIQAPLAFMDQEAFKELEKWSKKSGLNVSMAGIVNDDPKNPKLAVIFNPNK